MKLIGLTGPARSGKSTVAAELERRGFAVYALADAVKATAEAFLDFLGLEALEHYWDETRKEEPIFGLGVSPRFLWQTLGTDWGRKMLREDVWIRALEETIGRDHADGEPLDRVVIPDVRFVNEAQWVLDRGGEVWRIVRPGYEGQARDHASEAGIPGELITTGIINDGDLAALAARVGELLR